MTRDFPVIVICLHYTVLALALVSYTRLHGVGMNKVSSNRASECVSECLVAAYRSA